MSAIPPVDLAQQYRNLEPELQQAVLEVLASGRYIGGAAVTDFEQQFAHYIGVRECVSCNSGTDALYLSLRAVGVGAGDRVITTPFTFVASAETISALGATPVFVDIVPGTFNLDVAQVKQAITTETRAFLPVHLFGQPADMTRLLELGRSHGIPIIEDCAQSTGATWEGNKCGSIGRVGCFSFFPTKNLGTCGDGGAVTTDDPAIADTIRVLKDHGRCDTYIYRETGVNSRLDAIHAAILQVKLRHLDTWNERRRMLAKRYRTLLAGLSVPGLEAGVPGVVLPEELADGCGVWNQFTIQVTDGTPASGRSPEYRDRLRDRLQAAGIRTMVYYPLPLHLQPVYQLLNYQLGQFPVAEAAANTVLSLPIFPELSDAQQERVVYALKDCLTQSDRTM